MKKVLSLNTHPQNLEFSDASIDFIEWRLDLAPLDEKIARALTIPWIATLRDSSEGGQFQGDHSTRLETLKKALEYGATWIDLEARFSCQDLPLSKCLRSVHLDKDHSHDTRHHALRSLDQAPGALKKWVRPTDYVEDLCLEEKYLCQSSESVIVIHSGTGGLWTRLCPPGHSWSYLTANETQPTGSGQLSVDQLRNNSLRHLYGIIGNPVNHSLSPKVHNSIFKNLNASNFYIPIPVKELSNLFPNPANKFSGFSVTTPFKSKILEFVSEYDSICENINCANTLTNISNGWKATNTDAIALKNLLAPHCHENTRVAIFGTGGFGRAALWACKQFTEHVTLVNRSISSGEFWANKLGANFVPLEDWKFNGEDILIQATSAEMFDEPSPFDTSHCSGNTLLIESIYKTSTDFLTQAPPSCPRITGIDIFTAQAHEQANVWSEKDIPLSMIQEALV